MVALWPAGIEYRENKDQRESTMRACCRLAKGSAVSRAVEVLRCHLGYQLNYSAQLERKSIAEKMASVFLSPQRLSVEKVNSFGTTLNPAYCIPIPEEK